MKPRKIVITGIGLITPCGTGLEDYWRSTVRGESAIGHFSSFHMNGFPSTLAGEISHFEPEKYIKQKKSLKVMSREIRLAVAASQLAIEDAGLNLSAIDRTRFGISLGTGIINSELEELGSGIRAAIDEEGKFQIKKFGKEGLRALFPLWFLKYLPNMPACHISIANGLQGPSNTITTSSAAGAQALGEAFQVIKRGDADLMLAGGTDSKLNPMGISRFHLLGLLSIRNGQPPEKIYCPFDERSDGIVLGEGAGLLVLEEKEHALRRGARIYGEISGYGASSDFNYHPRHSVDYKGKKFAMTQALQEAGRDPSDIDFILANGSGIPQEDILESQAIHAVFENHAPRLKVTAVKPVTGHLVYGAGGIELVAGVMSLQDEVIPPVANLENPDPRYDLPFVSGEALSNKSKACLFNAFGFGGQNASLVVVK